jgi:hypothetical protein
VLRWRRIHDREKKGVRDAPVGPEARDSCGDLEGSRRRGVGTRRTVDIVLVGVGLGVFLVAGALAISLEKARFLGIHVIPRTERLLMWAVTYLGVAAALVGAARMLWPRVRAALARRRNVPPAEGS